MLVFNKENPLIIESSSGEEVEVKVIKQGKNWKFGNDRRSGEHSKARGSVVHFINSVVRLGSVENGWSPALCGSAPKGDGGWMIVSKNSEITCKKCLKTHGYRRFDLP